MGTTFSPWATIVHMGQRSVVSFPGSFPSPRNPGSRTSTKLNGSASRLIAGCPRREHWSSPYATSSACSPRLIRRTRPTSTPRRPHLRHGRTSRHRGTLSWGTSACRRGCLSSGDSGRITPDMVDTYGEVSGGAGGVRGAGRTGRGARVREVARAHGVSKTWLYELVARYHAEGEVGLVAAPNGRIVHQPVCPKRSRTRWSRSESSSPSSVLRPDPTRSTRTSPMPTAGSLRAQSRASGGSSPRRGFITPEPHKRPKSSYVRFEAALPNECWQMDVTHVVLKNGRSVDVLNVIDDHSRLCLARPASLRSRPPPTSSPPSMKSPSVTASRPRS